MPTPEEIRAIIRAQRDSQQGVSSGGVPIEKQPHINQNVSTQPPVVSKESEYQKPSGFLDTVNSALDYAGNISRSAIAGTLSGGIGQGYDYAKQAAFKERYTDPTKVKDLITNTIGLGKVRFGKDDGKYDPGDILDYAGDLVTDIATDPLTLATIGTSELAKVATKGTKLAADVSKAAKTAETAEKVARAGIGATYGLGATDSDASLSEKLVNAAAGAGLTYALGSKGLKNLGTKELIATSTAGAIEGYNLPGPDASRQDRLAGAALGASAILGAKFAKPIGNAVADAYAVGSRGSKFNNFSESYQLANNAMQKTQAIGKWIAQGRMKALEGLDDAGKVKASQLMQTIKSEFLTRRKPFEAELSSLGDEVGFNSNEFYKRSNEINKQINTELEAPGGFIQGLMKNEEDKTVKAITDWTIHNNDVIQKLNKETGKDLVGIKYHIDDIYEKADIDKSFKEAQEILDQVTLHRARMTERSGAAKSIEDVLLKKGEAKNSVEAAAKAHDMTYQIYAENIAKKFLNRQEAKAVNMMREYKNTMPVSKDLAKFEGYLKGFDQMTGFMKSQMLYFSLSWLKSNYWDNMTKALIEGGVGNMMDSATAGAFRKNLASDIWGLYGNKLKKYKSNEMLELLEQGVVDGVAFKAMTDDDDVLKFMMKPEDFLKYAENQKGLFHRAGEKMTAGTGVKAFEKVGAGVSKGAGNWNKFLSNTVGRVGSYMEGYSRASTYLRVKEALKASNPGLSEDAIRRMAADTTKKAFFDYGDVSYFEKATMKRLVPFYAFYSKNMPYWMDAITNPRKVGYVGAVQKIYNNIGQNPTARDKMGMTDYLKNANPRLLGKSGGEKIYGISPSMSMHDAIRMVEPGGLWSQIVEKSNPYFKVPLELAFGKDTFTGGDLYPSATRKGKKYIFSRGFKYYAARKALEAMGVKDATFQEWKKAIPALGTIDVALDKKGNPIALDDWNIVVDKVLGTAFPTGAIDQLVGDIGKNLTDKEDVDDAISNRLLPLQSVKMTPSYERLLRGKARREILERQRRERIQLRERKRFLK